MKGVLEQFFSELGMTEEREYDPSVKRPYLHPGRQADIVYKGVKVGYLGQVHPMVAQAYEIKGDVYVAVIDLPEILDFVTFDRKYEGIARFPAVTRDLSLVVPKDIMVGQIESMIRQRGGKLLETLELFDVYEGDQISAGFNSVAYSLSFRAKDRTLDENDVSGAMKKILNGLTSMGIELRA